MKLAISGAGGFLGRHVVTELNKRGLSGTLIVRPGSRIYGASGHAVVELDIAHPPDDAFEQLGRPDVLLHLAWGGLTNYRSMSHLEHELPMQYVLLSRLVRSGLAHLVVAGTCLEYGMQSGALDELLVARPITQYGYAKEVLYQKLQLLKQERSFSLTWGRLFYMYGEGQASNSLWSQLKLAVEQGAALFNMSGGEQLRDYLPVEVVVGYLVSLALTEQDTGVVNICSGKPISVRRLVERWISEHDWQIRPNLGYYPYPDYEPMAFWGSRAKLDACMRAVGN